MSTTDSRQLRMLVDGVLSAYGVDDLQLSIDLCEAFKKLGASPTPARTREDILAGIKNGMKKGADTQVHLDAIRAEIENRVRISPVGNSWEDFIKWAFKQEEKGEHISRFLDWWTADEWRLAHPPMHPNGWYVQWPQAFPKPQTMQMTTGSSSGYYA